jgi:hypothetical protein
MSSSSLSDPVVLRCKGRRSLDALLILDQRHAEEISDIS